MSTDTFFEEKKEWSVLKDTILDHYLKPYIAKILFTQRPLMIIDFFAGKGNFDDGAKGSPIIIAKHIKNVLESDNPHVYNNKNLSGYFIEKRYADDLAENLKSYKNCRVFKGRYEEHMQMILTDFPLEDRSLFLYIDPYGIKSLDFNYFERIARKNCPSVEILMNLNSFGFLREGCRVLKYDIKKSDDDENLLYENTGKENLNKIAGGTYWQTILQEYNENKISMADAEERFSFQYTNHLNKIFRYVVNIPIKEKIKNIAKYRLVFAADHGDALILMVNQMNKIWKQFAKDEIKGQSSIFDLMENPSVESKLLDFPDMIRLQGFDIEKDIKRFVSKDSQTLKDIIVNMMLKYGITFSEKEYKNIIKEMQKKGTLTVKRLPEKTPTGKQVISWDYNQYLITVELIT